MTVHFSPIDTVYKGCRFRSRLEARWAVFMDAMQMRWEYEKEGFNVAGRWYLPDFWLPNYAASVSHPGAGYWLEIKPHPLDVEQVAFFATFAHYSGHRVYVACGRPWANDHTVYVFQHHHNGRPAAIPLAVGKIEEVVWSFDEDEADIKIANAPSPFSPCPLLSGLINPRPGMLDKAFRKAMGARFEHDERD